MGKRNRIASLIEESDIQSVEDIQDAFKDLLAGTIESVLRSELYVYLGYEAYERIDSLNVRNESKSKNLISKYGKLEIDVPEYHEGLFKSQIVKKI